MKALSCTFLLTLFCLFINAQEETSAPEVALDTLPEPIFNLQMNFTSGHPLSDFKSELTDDLALGGDFALLFKVGESPIRLGANFGWMLIQRERLRFERTVIADYTEKFQLTTRSNIFLGHAVIRYEPKTKFFIKPYLDAYLGTQYFFTNTVLSERNNNGNNDNGSGNTLDRVKEQGDWGFSYGAGLGLLFSLDKHGEAFLNFSCSYIKSGNAEFMVRTPDGIVSDDTADVFEKRNSNIDLLIPKIGLVVKIQDCD